jgi:hypothetical protein
MREAQQSHPAWVRGANPRRYAASMRLLAVASALLIAACCHAQQVDPNKEVLAEIRAPEKWSVREVGVGVELRQRRFEKLFTGPQGLTTLTIAADAKSARFDVEAPGKLTRTSAMGKKLGAIAAINGGFFEPDASPRGLLKLDGKLANPANADQGSVGIDEKGRIAIEKRAEGDWPQMREALGERQRSIRHPRSAIGAKKDGSLVLLAIDGRAKEAAGTSYEETATILVALGCEFAINLDGGGSTTLWTAGQGVCNFPCDNKTFDHAGERAVANALLLFATPVVEIDDDEAQLFGSGFAQRTDGKGLRGVDCTVWTSEGESAPPMAVFVARLPRAGKWTAHVWLPEIPESKLAFRAAAAVGGELPRLDDSLHTGKPGSWVEIGVVETKGEERATISIAAARGMPFVADAVKFVAAE